MKRRVLAALGLGLVLSGCASVEERRSDEEQQAPIPSASVPVSGIAFTDDFASDPRPRWQPITPSAWHWDKAAGNYALAENAPLEESVRAPFNRNLVKDLVVGDFQFDVDLQSTTRDYPNQSLCLFFGYQDPAHMYYVHFGRKASGTSNQIFIVNGKDRTPISTKTTSGTVWDDAWHHARIVRRATKGAIEVYFDDMDTPVMTASDTTFAEGQVGIGSFDDTGRFDNVVVRDLVSRDRQP